MHLCPRSGLSPPGQRPHVLPRWQPLGQLRACSRPLCLASRPRQCPGVALALGTVRQWSQHSRRRAVQMAAGRPGGGLGSDSQEDTSGWQTFWGVVDASAMLGAVGAAAAFLITQEAMLAAAPVALPLLAIYAGRQRERLQAEASRAELVERSQQVLERVAQLARGAAGEAAATEIARAVELQEQAATASAGVLKGLESKLAAIEGSVLSTGSTTREALRESAMAQGRLAQQSVARVEELATALRQDVSAELRQTGADETNMLVRLEARLASLEGAIRQMEASQAEGLRRVSSSMTSALLGAEEGLEMVVRQEAARSLEPLRRLPQLLADAMPVVPEVLPPSTSSPQAGVGLSEEALRELVSEQLAAATRTILQQQAELLQQLRQQPAMVAPAQWNQLGARLLSLDEEVKQLLAAQQAAQQALQQAQRAPAAGAELAEQLAALRADVAALGASVEKLAQLAAAGPSSTVDGAAEGEDSAGVASTAAAAQQTQQLGEALQLLRGLAATLDGLGQQVAASAAAQQAQETATPLPPPPAPEAPSVAEAAVAAEQEAREEAYRRMQALLAGSGRGSEPAEGSAVLSEELGMEAEAAAAAPAEEEIAAGSSQPEGAAAAAAGAGAEGGQQPSVPIREWLSGGGGLVEDAATAAEQQQLEVVAAGAGAGAPLVAAGAGAGSNGAGGLGAEAAGGGVSPFVQSQIEYAAALGVLYSSEEDQQQQAQQGERPQQEEQQQPPPPQQQQQQEQQEAPASSAAPQPDATWEGVQAGATAPPASEPASEPTTTQWGEPVAATAEQPQQWWQPPAGEQQQQWELQQWQQQQQQQQQQQWGQPPVEQQQWAQPADAQWQQPVDQQQYAAAATAPPAAAATPDTGSQPAAWGYPPAAAAAAAPEEPASAQPFSQPGPALERAARAPAAGLLYDGLRGLSVEELYARGRQRLQEGRALAETPGSDWGVAEALLFEAQQCLEAAVEQQPDFVKAWGNLGNALLCRGRLKRRMLQLLRQQMQAAAQQGGELAAAEARLEREAQEVLLLAGRKYRRVLELDDSQVLAMINWGRVVGLRADLGREKRDLEEAARLFGNAADKFDSALDLDPQNVLALRLGGFALLDMALCLMDTDRKQAKQLLKDAESYLQSAVLGDPEDTEAARRLEECRQWLEYIRAAR